MVKVSVRVGVLLGVDVGGRRVLVGRLSVAVMLAMMTGLVGVLAPLLLPMPMPIATASAIRVMTATSEIRLVVRALGLRLGAGTGMADSRTAVDSGMVVRRGGGCPFAGRIPV